MKRSLKRGNLNRSAVGNPVLVPLGMSVETLHDPPKALLGYGEEKVQTTNITLCDGSENCSWYECGGRVFESHRRHHLLAWDVSSDPSWKGHRYPLQLLVSMLWGRIKARNTI